MALRDCGALAHAPCRSPASATSAADRSYLHGQSGGLPSSRPSGYTLFAVPVAKTLTISFASPIANPALHVANVLLHPTARLESYARGRRCRCRHHVSAQFGHTGHLPFRHTKRTPELTFFMSPTEYQPHLSNHVRHHTCRTPAGWSRWDSTRVSGADAESLVISQVR